MITALNILLHIPFTLGADDTARILKACPDANIELRASTSGAALEEIDGSFVDVLVSESVPRKLSAWPRLKFVQCMAAGLNHLEAHPIWNTGIPLATASGIHSVPMAEFATCALLMLAHRFPEITEFGTTRQWPDRTSLSGDCLRGKTAGILGYGSIGRECARQLQAIGMKIHCLKRDPASRKDSGFNAWPQTGDPDGVIPERWFSSKELTEFLQTCDALIVTAPRTSETTDMIGVRELSLLRSGAFVVVVSRGGIVNELALASALNDGSLGGAAIDCFSQEPPPPDNPLFSAARVILTPHMSGVYRSYWLNILELFCENLIRWKKGNTLLNLADGKLGY